MCSNAYVIFAVRKTILKLYECLVPIKYGGIIGRKLKENVYMLLQLYYSLAYCLHFFT